MHSMKKEISKAPISVKYDWENNPKVRPNKVEFKGVKAPIKKEAKIVNPDVTKDVQKGDGKMVSKIPMVRHDLTIGKRPGSPKKMEKYSSTDGSLTSAKEVKPAKTMKEGFTFNFNKLYYDIMQEAADPNAAPPAPPAPPADPAAAGAPPADPAAGLPPDPAAAGADDPAAELEGEAGGGLVGQLEEAYNALESAIAMVQDQAAQESLNGVKDTLASAYEMLTGTPLAGAEEAGAEGDAGAPGEVPNMEQGAAPADPNAAAGGAPADPNAAPAQ